MNKTVNLLAELYSKIMSGEASDEEKARYETETAISCIQEDVLIEAVKQRAMELEKNE